MEAEAADLVTLCVFYHILNNFPVIYCYNNKYCE